VIEKREIAGLPYFTLARRYPDGASAEHVFDRLNEAGRQAKGRLDLGVYRLVPGGVGEPTVIAIVSFGRKGVEFADLIMGGEPTDVVKPEEFDALMARRARVVGEILDSGEMKKGGQMVIRRGKRGAYLRPDGTFDERIGEG
jgi:hypothetical protein